MGWSKYSIRLFIFLVILSLTGFAFFWSLSSSQLIITRIVIALVFVLFFVFLLKYLNRANSDLLKFLKAIQYLENIPAPDVSGLSFDKLNITYHEITSQLKKAWLAKEYEHQYFQYTIENIGIGILSFDKEGNVELCNKAAQDILGVTSLKNINELKTIADTLLNLTAGKTKILKLDTQIDQLAILVKSTDIKIGKKELKLLSLQDIKTQLEESELEAWQKLIRVLTHEIMNSVTPIKSLTYSMQKILKGNDTEPEKNHNLLKGLTAIEKRSKGLLDFVESYKNLTKIPKLAYERVFISKLINNCIDLLKNELEKEEIKIDINFEPDDISVIADEKLISQVIINLFQNAIKALKAKKKKIIEIQSYLSADNKIILKIRDNGKGIDAEAIDKIFVPFYSTYEDGSGIGLSFARQIMVMHNARIEVQSKAGKETIFTLIF